MRRDKKTRDNFQSRLRSRSNYSYISSEPTTSLVSMTSSLAPESMTFMERKKKIYIILDMEALFVPTLEDTKTIIPVSEIAWIVLSKKSDSRAWKIEQQFTSLVQLSSTTSPWTVEQTTTLWYIYDHITGLDPHYVQQYGTSLENIQTQLRILTETYPDAQWVARGPELENRVLSQWSLSSVIHVKEILQELPEKYQCIFVYHEGRPWNLRCQACHAQCSHHYPYDGNVEPSPKIHCAGTDVMEECLWLIHYCSH